MDHQQFLDSEIVFQEKLEDLSEPQSNELVTVDTLAIICPEFNNPQSPAVPDVKKRNILVTPVMSEDLTINFATVNTVLRHRGRQVEIFAAVQKRRQKSINWPLNCV